jgi:amino acid transporter
MILALIGALTFFFVVPSLLALIFGLVARRKIANSQGRQKGLDMAWTGIILGGTAVAFMILYIVLEGTGVWH